MTTIPDTKPCALCSKPMLRGKLSRWLWNRRKYCGHACRMKALAKNPAIRRRAVDPDSPTL